MAPPITDEAVEAAKRIRDTAMEQAMAARIPESGHFGAIAQDADWLVDHITAALPHMGGVSVKPLEWSDPRQTDDYSWAQDAKTEIGLYIATDNGWFLHGQTGWEKADDIEHAKAAAQADYERRILSALSSPAPEADVDDYLREGTTDSDPLNYAAFLKPAPEAALPSGVRSGDAQDIANRLRRFFDAPGDARRLALDAAMMIEYLNSKPAIAPTQAPVPTPDAAEDAMIAARLAASHGKEGR